MEFDLVRTFGRPPLEDAEVDRGERADRLGLLCVFEDFGAGVVFLFHAYNVAQMPRKASFFFIFFFGLDPSPFLKTFERSFYFLWAGG